MSKLSETSTEKPSENPTGQTTALLSSDLDLESKSKLLSQLEFSPGQRRVLLAIAHQAILFGLEGRSFPEAPPFPAGLPPELSDPRGVFTTLYLDRELRGCVGYAVPIAPLHRAVAETARAAAFEDSRFSPVTKDEGPRLKVSLSVLSALAPIRPEAVEVGRHGLVISQGAHRGLLLPQVPVEHGWDRETFLEQTCRKAGLPLDAWGKAATIEAFTAEVFGDNDV
jgi:AmmeMemoRadiSam system protein A